MTIVIERCPSCYGRKITMGMGMIDQECPACKGIGHISKERQPQSKGKKNHGREAKDNGLNEHRQKEDQKET
jgi:hypothetical protein